MKNKAHSREMLMALQGDREWEIQLAVDTDEQQSSLEGDVNSAASESRVGDSVGRGHRKKKERRMGGEKKFIF